MTITRPLSLPDELHRAISQYKDIAAREKSTQNQAYTGKPQPNKDLPYTTPTTTGGGVFFWPQTGQTVPASNDTVHFGFLKQADKEEKVEVPNAAYRVLLRTPKTELHVHQSGSSDIAYLKFALLQRLYDNTIVGLRVRNGANNGKTGHVDVRKMTSVSQMRDELKPMLSKSNTSVVRGKNVAELYYYNPQTAQVEFIPIDDILKSPNAGERQDELLDLQNLTSVFRVVASSEREKIFLPDAKDIPLKEGETVDDAKQRLVDDGLQRYRDAYKPLYPLVKNVPATYLLSELLARDNALENVRYLEYRIAATGDPGVGAAPLPPEEVVGLVNQGFQDAKYRLARRHIPYDYGLIILFERNKPPKEAIELAHKAINLRKMGFPIVGVDLAGGEVISPVTQFKEAFNIIREYNETAPKNMRIGITIHTGETERSCDVQPWEKLKTGDPKKAPHDCSKAQPGETHLSGPQTIQEALDMSWSPKTPFRIGHGIQLINSSPELKEAFEKFRQHPGHIGPFQRHRLLKSSPLLKEVIEKGIVVEQCPKSNVATLAVPYYDQHPGVFLSRLGVKVSLSTDGRTISNSDTPNEYVKLFKYSGAKYRDFKKMVINGFEGAFVQDPQAKKALVHEVKQRMARNEGSIRYQVGIYQLNHGFKRPNPFAYIPIMARCVAASPKRLWYNISGAWSDTHKNHHGNPFIRPNINGDGKRKSNYDLAS